MRGKTVKAPTREESAYAKRKVAELLRLVAKRFEQIARELRDVR